MKTFDPILKRQHVNILKALNEVCYQWKELNIAACGLALNKLSFLLSEHHDSEFSILFSKIWNDPKLKEGGPFCTYFFNFFLNDRPFARVTKIINQVRSPKNTMLSCEIPENLQPLFENNSMASIPIEEHLATKNLAREMNYIILNWDKKNLTWFSMALNELQELIQKNIEKEETCLWALTEEIV